MYYNGTEITLEKKTLKIAKLIDQTEKSQDMVSVYKSMLATVKAAAGESETKNILGTLSIEEVDLTELTLLYNSIIGEYDHAIEEAQREKNEELFDSPIFEKITELANSVETLMALKEK